MLSLAERQVSDLLATLVARVKRVLLAVATVGEVGHKEDAVPKTSS